MAGNGNTGAANFLVAKVMHTECVEQHHARLVRTADVDSTGSELTRPARLLSASSRKAQHGVSDPLAKAKQTQFQSVEKNICL